MLSDYCSVSPSGCAPSDQSKLDAARRPRSAPVSLTSVEIAAQHDRCCVALIDEALRVNDVDCLPFRIDLLHKEGRVIETVRRRTQTHDNGPTRLDYPVPKTWSSLPRADQKLSERMGRDLRALRLDPNKLWAGVATRGALCLVAEVGAARRDLMNGVRSFFARHSRNTAPPELIFSTVQDPVRNRKTGQLRRDAAGRLLFHVHVHFLFYPSCVQSREQKFQRAFLEQFGSGSGLEKVITVNGIIGYLTAVPDRSDLLDHNEFVKWHYQIWRTPRFRLYGRFRTKPIRRVKLKPRNPAVVRTPALAKANRFLGKIFYGKKCFSIWEHLTQSPEEAYANQSIPRERDLEHT
jgi:hypothetical protein